jgi:hypothetical protein
MEIARPKKHTGLQKKPEDKRAKIKDSISQNSSNFSNGVFDIPVYRDSSNFSNLSNLSNSSNSSNSSNIIV